MCSAGLVNSSRQGLMHPEATDHPAMRRYSWVNRRRVSEWCHSQAQLNGGICGQVLGFRLVGSRVFGVSLKTACFWGFTQTCLLLKSTMICSATSSGGVAVTSISRGLKPCSLSIWRFCAFVRVASGSISLTRLVNDLRDRGVFGRQRYRTPEFSVLNCGVQ